MNILSPVLNILLNSLSSFTKSNLRKWALTLISGLFLLAGYGLGCTALYYLVLPELGLVGAFIILAGLTSLTGISLLLVEWILNKKERQQTHLKNIYGLVSSAQDVKAMLSSPTFKTVTSLLLISLFYIFANKHISNETSNKSDK